MSLILMRKWRGLWKDLMDVVLLLVKMISLYPAGACLSTYNNCYGMFILIDTVKFRLATVASGAASGKLLEYEVGGPSVCVQTAYGVEVEVFYPV